MIFISFAWRCQDVAKVHYIERWRFWLRHRNIAKKESIYPEMCPTSRGSCPHQHCAKHVSISDVREISHSTMKRHILQHFFWAGGSSRWCWQRPWALWSTVHEQDNEADDVELTALESLQDRFIHRKNTAWGHFLTGLRAATDVTAFLPHLGFGRLSVASLAPGCQDTKEAQKVSFQRGFLLKCCFSFLSGFFRFFVLVHLQTNEFNFG